MTDRIARVLSLVAVTLAAVAAVLAWKAVNDIDKVREEIRVIGETLTAAAHVRALEPLPLRSPPPALEPDSR